MSVAEELTFHLEDFDGPLELLLALVAKHKMDLHNIPILELIDQYTRTVEQADPDPETASAFIEMAAHLVEMKSFLLLPRSEEGERMKQELTGQLIEYDQCRRMAALLRAKGEQADFDQILADMIERDYQDSHRAVAPLRPAEDAVLLDSTGLTLDEVVDRIVELTKKGEA